LLATKINSAMSNAKEQTKTNTSPPASPERKAGVKERPRPEVSPEKIRDLGGTVPTPEVFAFEDEVTQKTNDAWAKAVGVEDAVDADGKKLVPLRGEGRTAEVVRGDLKLYRLGLVQAELAKKAISSLLKKLTTKPEEVSQKANDEWVKENLGERDERDERDGLLKLRGDGRTAEVIAEEIDLVIAGAQFGATSAVSELPAEVSQKANDEWIKENKADGIIAMRGKGRTGGFVREGMKLFHLGATTAAAKVAAARGTLLSAPEETRDALFEWVQTNLGTLDERDGVLKLTGEDRTKEVLAKEVAIVIAGAKHVLEAKAPEEASAEGE